MKWTDVIVAMLRFGAEGVSAIRAARARGDGRSVDVILSEARLERALAEAEKRAEERFRER